MKDKNIKDIIVVTFSNVLVLLAGVFTSFLIPKFLGLTQYGLYKIFTLYISYTAIIEIGYFEGIYLKYTAVPEEKYDMTSFRAYFKTYMLINMFFSLAVFIFSQIVFDDEYKIIFIFVVIYALISNIINYFQIISQCLLRFGEFALRNIIKSVLLIVIVSAFFIINKLGTSISYISFLICYICIFVIIVVWYALTYKRYIWGEARKIIAVKNESIEFIRIGFPLLIANLCSTLILTLDRQFVSILFSTENYALYSFAYSMLALFTTLTSSISLIVFPSLKILKKDELKIKYYEYEKLLFILASIFLILYFPLRIVIQFILPQYMQSLRIFQIILPTLGFSIVISILLQNYYKTLKKNKLYFYLTLIILAVSFMLNGVFYAIFKTMESISFASFVTVFVWYFITYINLKRILKLNKYISFYPIIYLLLSIIFLAITNSQMGSFFQAVIYLIFCVIAVSIMYLKKEN